MLGLAPPGTESTTKHPAQATSRLTLGLSSLGTLVFVLSLSPICAHAQTAADLKQKAEQAGIKSEEDARRRARDSGLTRDQIRQALHEAGYNDAAVNELLNGAEEDSSGRGAGGGVGGAGAPAYMPPAPIDSQAVEPALGPPPRAPLNPEDYPEFTKEIARRIPGSSPVLPFGYEIFGYLPSTFEPLSSGPVDPEYPIGPGDEVIIQVWGDNEFTHAAVVGREATITVPDIGQIVLNGLTLAQAKRLITDRLGAVYSGIRTRRPTTFVDVTLGKLRTIQVFILGDVVRPGGYTISSVSTVLNALYNAGGPTSHGSMRDVRIVRHNEVWKHVDLYGYILRGSKAEDVRLQSGDVVFIPPTGKVAAILGEVHRSAIYELRDGEGFRDLLRLAGGLQSTAVVGRALVDRVVPFGQRDSLRGEDRVAVDLPLRQILADSTSNPPLADRDIVQVFRIGETRTNTVVISGSAVLRPGMYELRPGMRVSDLVNAGGLKPDAYFDRATLVRTAEDRSRSIQRFNLRDAMEHQPEDDLVLQKLDEVTVRSIWDIQERHTVSITGSVREPGKYEYLNGMTIMDLIFRAGGLKESAYKQEAEVSRVDSTTIASRQAAEVFRVPISGNYGVHSADTTFSLRQYDQVFVREIPDWQLQRNVLLTGEVRYPGVYSLNAKDERLSSVLERAGGVKPTGYPRAAVFVRRKGGAGRLAIDVEDVSRRHHKRYDIVLEDGDSLNVPREPKTVKVVGEVGFPVSVLYERGKPLGFYIDQAGGYTDNSDKGRVKVVQPNGRVKPVKRFWWDPAPEAGALVVVPPKPPEEKKETLKDVATITSILTAAVTSLFVIHEATK